MRCQGAKVLAHLLEGALLNYTVSYIHIWSLAYFGSVCQNLLRYGQQGIPGLSTPAAFLVFNRNNPKHCAGSCDKSRIAFQMTSWTDVLASEWEEETIHYITVLGAVIHFELQMFGMDLWQCLTENSWVMRCLNLRDVNGCHSDRLSLSMSYTVLYSIYIVSV